MKYRSRSDIIIAVLTAALRGATKTRIMYGALLSYAQVQEYLAFMKEKDLIRREEGTGLYRATEKGLELLRAFEGIEEMVSVKSGPRARDQNSHMAW